MAITVRRNPSDRILELGGGSKPMVHPKCMGGNDCAVDCRMAQNEQGQQTVDFTADFNEPLPIQSDEFDAVFSMFCLEHISWRKTKQFIAEMKRVVKPGGKVICITANTEAQMKFIQENPNGWDGKDSFESFSCVIFGDNDYTENSHRNYMSSIIATNLFQEAGFERILIQPYGARNTDLCVEAYKPISPIEIKVPEEKIEVIEKKFDQLQQGPQEKPVVVVENKSTLPAREELFDREYFNGGAKFGGYAREGYWDYPVHEITFQHVMARKPESVLEIGAAKGFILKRIQDAGIIKAEGLEISKHCYMTRACEGIHLQDICKTPWPLADKEFDLCYSVAVMEHIPEEFLPAVISEIHRVSKRSLHGIDFGEKDSGFDKTHCSLHSKDWWIDKFHQTQQHRLMSIEIVDKEELERGVMPPEVIQGDGKIKLNIGCAWTMHHHGWINTDVLDQSAFAQQHGYKFQKFDCRQGMPFDTESVDLMLSCHHLEHLTYKEGLAFLKECRRIIKPTGVMRIIVPDTQLLMDTYESDILGHIYQENYPRKSLFDFDQINTECAESPTVLGKLWSLIRPGHEAAYDRETLVRIANAAGFDAKPVQFRQTLAGQAGQQILRETTEMLPCLSLAVELTPITG